MQCYGRSRIAAFFKRIWASASVEASCWPRAEEGKVGISFGRYGDSPERNGIPAKQFAIVADDELELQISMARYEPTVVDITIAVTIRSVA